MTVPGRSAKSGKHAANKPTAKKSAAKKAPKKTTAKKPAAKKLPAKKPAAKKLPAKKRAGNKQAEQKLAKYRAKRDFAKTAEPKGGTEPSAKAGNRFVVQRHRARRLHYDLRLELDGVLVSWAVPKGPTLDPAARRMAVHVEDHPLEYFDFEGVIPEGEYGGGDVIVWDWGTWASAEGKDAAGGLKKGEVHFDLEGQKLRGRFALVRRGDDTDKEQWLLIHKRDEHSQPGWDPEDHPTSVKSSRTNDEVAGAPEDEWTRDRPTVAAWARGAAWDPPAESELDALDALEREGTWEFGGEEIRLTNLDKVVFPARPGEEPVTKRDLIRYHARIAPFMLPYLAGRPVNLHRYPAGADKKGFWHKARPDHAPDFVTPWRYDDAGEGETEWYSVIDNPATLVWMANYGAIELNPWTSRIPDVHEPTWALIDVDPGPDTTGEELLTLCRLYRTAIEHVKVRAMPKVTGKRGVQIWVPIAAGYSFDETQAWVEGLSRPIGQVVPDLVSWKWTKRDRGGKARLDYTQNAINKTLVAPFSARPAAGAPVSVPITWDELDDSAFAPDRWTIRDVVERVRSFGDPLAELIGLQQRLPALK